MDEIRRMFTRTKKQQPVTIDLTETQANGLHRNGDSANGDTDADPHANTTAQLAPPRSGRGRSVAELQRGYDEVMDLVRKISDHLDTQTQRTERMMQWMEHMPQALEALPEVSRQNARMIEILNEHLSHINARDSSLNNTLSRLGESSQHQTEVLGLLQQQLDNSSRSAEQMTETLGSFREALGNLASTNNRSTEILSNVVKANEERESTLTAMFERTQRWMIAAAILIGTLAVGAIALSAMAIIKA